MGNDSLQAWLVREVRQVLDRSGSMPPLLLWCDPQREWLDLLRAASEHDGFELWAPAAGAADDHGLLVPDRFCTASRAPRVVWLPCARDEITWFKPFEPRRTDQGPVAALSLNEADRHGHRHL